ncbi:MarR family winged helix-turn-helix transcriptional regulator [Nitratidesulfovibrio sp.]|uniref:MarR family winged helix-turn-helix transcriptional regulator n=1 Tax=Nitratidesulfovibrio sp. TaxID=2802297 RepID=UPI003341D488
MPQHAAIAVLFESLEKTLVTYSEIERKAYDFGVGMPLYPAEMHMISKVHKLGGASITELAQQTGVTKGAVSMLVSKLVQKGLLEKNVDPDNRSRVVVCTTGAGERASASHEAFHARHDKEFLAWLGTLDEGSFASINEFGRRMSEWMRGYLDE